MLHWKLREALKAMHDQDGTVEVLIELICRANIRWRCWPGMDLISDETGCAISVVTAAKKWLLKHKAIYLVPYAQRIGKELELPARQHVYQLTGMLEIDGYSIPYLNLNDESWHEIQDEVAQILALSDNVSQDEISSDEVSRHETKGITSLEDDSTISPASPEQKGKAARIAAARLGSAPALGKTDEQTKEQAREPLSALEEYLAQAKNLSKKTLPYKLAQKLLETPKTNLSHVTFENAAQRWLTSPLYRRFVDEKIEYWRFNSKDYQLDHLINLVCMIDGDFGWYEYMCASENDAGQPVADDNTPREYF